MSAVERAGRAAASPKQRDGGVPGGTRGEGDVTGAGGTEAAQRN